MLTAPLIHRKDLRERLGVTAETLRVWRRDGKVPPPDIDVSARSQWWRPDTLAAAGFKMFAEEASPQIVK